MTPPLRMCLVNLKPGTAKTTCGVFLSAALHAAGLAVLHVDADPQASALAWSDQAGGFPWAVIGLPKKTLLHDVVTVTKRGQYDAVVIDTPQIEDHWPITREALKYCNRWVVTLAPSGIEVDRTAHVVDFLDQVDNPEARRYALLNRTNRRKPSKAGPDTQTRQALQDALGLDVLADQVPNSDGMYRQQFGCVPADLDRTPFPSIVNELLETTAA